MLLLLSLPGIYEHPEFVSDKDMIIAAPAFETEQVITAFGFILGLLLRAT